MIKTKKLTFLFCFFFTLITTVKAQNGTDASGGDASGSGGSASLDVNTGTPVFAFDLWFKTYIKPAVNSWVDFN